MIEICDDVREECGKFGQVVELKIPRPTGGSRQSPGVGKIFVKFDSIESTTAALKSLAGRKFSDRTVVTTYFSEVSFSLAHVFLSVLTCSRKTSTSTPGSRPSCTAFLFYSTMFYLIFPGD
jgi:splicing factor U2AF subunit